MFNLVVFTFSCLWQCCMFLLLAFKVSCLWLLKLCIAVLLQYSWNGNWLYIYFLCQGNGTSTSLDFSLFPSVFIPYICLLEVY